MAGPRGRRPSPPPRAAVRRYPRLAEAWGSASAPPKRGRAVAGPKRGASRRTGGGGGGAGALAEADDEAGGCVPAAPWQAGGHRPTCVDVHAIGLRPTRSAPPGDGPTFLAQGGWRGVWLVPPREGAGGRGDDLGGMGHRPSYYVVKTIRYSSDDVDLYSPGTYRRHQIDAMASERLSGTGTAAAIYGFCGHSVLNERARSSLLRRIKDLGRKDREQGFRLDWDGAVERAKEGGREALKGRRVGTIRFGGGGMGFGEGKREAKAEPEWPTLAARLGYARDAARLVAEMRRVDSCGKDGAGREGGGGDSYSYNVTIVHKDLKPDNILVFSGGDRGDGKLGDVLRLGDFNDAQLQWHNATAAAAAAGGGGGDAHGAHPCAFLRPRHNANYQSREEAHELPLTDTVDLHALGSVLYFVLFGRMPFWDLDEPDSFAYLSVGIFPLLPGGYWDDGSAGGGVAAVLSLIQKLRAIDPAARPSAYVAATELEVILSAHLRRVGGNAHKLYLETHI